MTFKSTLPMIGLAVVFLVLTALLRVAETSGLLDGDTGTRSFMVFTGLMVMVFGNVVPKQLKRPRATPDAEQRIQNALRSVGWTMTLAGLVFAGVWLFAPEVVAQPVSIGALGLAFLVAVFHIVRGCRGVPSAA